VDNRSQAPGPWWQDINQFSSVDAALGSQSWDAVVDFIAFSAEELEQRIALFGKRCKQYVFISSASAYQKPAEHYLITEGHTTFESLLGLLAEKNSSRASTDESHAGG
jgi:hypothetical protein